MRVPSEACPSSRPGGSWIQEQGTNTRGVPQKDALRMACTCVYVPFAAAAAA